MIPSEILAQLETMSKGSSILVTVAEMQELVDTAIGRPAKLSDIQAFIVKITHAYKVSVLINYESNVRVSYSIAYKGK